MKKFFFILITFVLTTGISYAANPCSKLNNLLERKAYKQCLADNNIGKKPIVSGTIEDGKKTYGNIKSFGKKFLDKLNTKNQFPSQTN